MKGSLWLSSFSQDFEWKRQPIKYWPKTAWKKYFPNLMILFQVTMASFTRITWPWLWQGHEVWNWSNTWVLLVVDSFTKGSQIESYYPSSTRGNFLLLITQKNFRLHTRLLSIKWRLICFHPKTSCVCETTIVPSDLLRNQVCFNSSKLDIIPRVHLVHFLCGL